VKATVNHNLTDEQLIKALAALADSSGIGEELQKAIKAKTAKCACDDQTPREPRHPAVRHLYHQFLRQFDEANRDIERYAREIMAE